VHQLHEHHLRHASVEAARDGPRPDRGARRHIRIQGIRLEHQQDRTTELALQASNAIADRDTTRNVALESKAVAALLNDSLRVAEKRVVQRTQAADSLDRALNRERAASSQLS